MIDVTSIVGALIALIGAIITAVVIPYIRARTTAEQRSQLQMLVNVAVAAAEQLIQGDKCGAQRKRSVIDFLAARGIVYDADEVDAMIEAAVYALKANSDVLYSAELDSTDEPK